MQVRAWNADACAGMDGPAVVVNTLCDMLSLTYVENSMSSQERKGGSREVASVWLSGMHSNSPRGSAQGGENGGEC